MVVRKIVFSDLTNKAVEEADHVTVIIREHPQLEGPVRLDASAQEVADIADNDSDFVIVEIHGPDGTETRIVEQEKFDLIFKVDINDALEHAERLDAPAPRRRGRPAGTTNKPKAVVAPAKVKRDPAQLQAIREWWRGQGNEIGDRGRIPKNVEEAYNEAHKA